MWGFFIFQLDDDLSTKQAKKQARVFVQEGTKTGFWEDKDYATIFPSGERRTVHDVVVTLFMNHHLRHAERNFSGLRRPSSVFSTLRHLAKAIRWARVVA